MDYAVHENFQARIVEWVAIPFSRGSSHPRDRTQGSNPGLPHCGRILYQLSHWGQAVVHILTVKHVVISSVHFFFKGEPGFIGPQGEPGLPGLPGTKVSRVFSPSFLKNFCDIFLVHFVTQVTR